MALLLLPASALGQMVSGIYYSGNPGTQCSDFADAVVIETAQMCLKAINSFSFYLPTTTVALATSGPKGCSYFNGMAQLNMGTGDSLSNRNVLCATERCAPDDESIHFIPRDQCGAGGSTPATRYIYTTQAEAEAACIAEGCSGLASAVAWEARYDLPLTVGGGGGASATGNTDPYELAPADLTCADIGRAEVAHQGECDAAALYLQGVNGPQGADGIPDVTSQGIGGVSYLKCYKMQSTGTLYYQNAAHGNPSSNRRAVCSGLVSTEVQTASEPCLIARTGSNTGWNCYAAWWSDRDTGTGSWFMRPDQIRSGSCGNAGWNDWTDFVGGGAACTGCPDFHVCPPPPPSASPSPPPSPPERDIIITLGYGICAGEAACEFEALRRGLAVGHAQSAFAGNYATKGCYFYPVDSGAAWAGSAFFGRGGTPAQEQTTTVGALQARLLCKDIDPPSPPQTTCDADSYIDKSNVPMMTDHQHYNEAAGHVSGEPGNADSASGNWNGCASTCYESGGCGNNPDIALDEPIKFCLENEDNLDPLTFPRCAAECNTARLQDSCIGLCGGGTYCCPAADGACIPNGTPCPCPACATPFKINGVEQCTNDSPMYFVMQHAAGTTACCAPHPPPPPSTPPAAPPSTPPSTPPNTPPSAPPAPPHAAARPRCRPSAAPR